MLWFEGSIPDAIQASKTKKSLFIIYIYGEDEMSEQMNSTWSSDSVSKLCESRGAVAIRIQSNSQDCTNFSQIYPVVVVPSTFFIGEGGVPLEVIGGQVTPEEFVTKMEQVFKLHDSQKQTAATTGQQGEITASGSGDTTPDGASASGSTEPSMSTAPLEDRVEKAKVLMEQKRLEKEQKEKEKQKQNEIERRRMGQDLQKLKEFQQEAELREVREQMKKDKEAERLAKERVKQQIARDREERKAKFQKDKEEKDREMEEKKKARLMEEQAKAEVEEAKKSETARIQVRFSDGSSATYSFPSSEPLQTLVDKITERVNGPTKISTTFPKRTFTEEDMSRSFIDLRLAPSAVVIAVPAQGMGTGGGRSVVSGGGVLSILLSPLMLLWNFIYSLIFGNSAGGNSHQTASQQTSDSPSDVSSSSRPGRPERPKTAYKRRTDGNIHRVADMRDDDDDMTTYNGNSTQQL